MRLIWNRRASVLVTIFIISSTVLLPDATRAALTMCHEYTEKFLFEDLPPDGVSESDPASPAVRISTTTCHYPTGSANASCYEFTKRNAEGPAVYYAGCGSKCPVEQDEKDIDCRLCTSSDMCNSRLVTELRKPPSSAGGRLSCYTGLHLKTVMTEERSRRVWCADKEKQCFLIGWESKETQDQKLFGGCGFQACVDSEATCRYFNCTEPMCNRPLKRNLPCPKTDCGAAGLEPGTVTVVFLSTTALVALILAK